jgi:hypothetical protein
VKQFLDDFLLVHDQKWVGEAELLQVSEDTSKFNSPVVELLHLQERDEIRVAEVIVHLNGGQYSSFITSSSGVVIVLTIH